MSNLTHFVDLTLRSPGDAGFLMAKLVHGVHSFIKYELPNSTDQDQVAIALPEMLAGEAAEQSGASAFVGRVVRVFASEHLLNKFRHYPAIAPFLRTDVTFGAIRPVPANAKVHHAYRRLRSADKETAAGLARINRRRQVNGIEPLADKQKVVRRNDRVFLTTSSATHRVRFSLFVVRDERPAAAGQFNSYGLSKGGTVPHF